MRLADLVEARLGPSSESLDARHISGYRVRCDLSDSVQRSLFYTGTYEPKTTGLIREALRPGDTFLDVGANVGHYTLLAASVVGSKGRVHAVEASRATAERLEETVTRNELGGVVSVHLAAAADRRYEATVHAAEGEHAIGMRNIRPEQDGVAIERVEAWPLDDLLPDVRPDVVKVDVEGSDLRALVGMRKLLESARPRLVIVESQDQLLASFGDSAAGIDGFMSELGYRGEPVAEPWHAPSVAYRPAELARLFDLREAGPQRLVRLLLLVQEPVEVGELRLQSLLLAGRRLLALRTVLGARNRLARNPLRVPKRPTPITITKTPTTRPPGVTGYLSP